jgi:hypothetical protein
VLPSAVQRASPQVTGFVPEPLPQQYWLDGFPFCLPLQSIGQLRQFSSRRGWQTSLPHGLQPDVSKASQVGEQPSGPDTKP